MWILPNRQGLFVLIAEPYKKATGSYASAENGPMDIFIFSRHWSKGPLAPVPAEDKDVHRSVLRGCIRTSRLFVGFCYQYKQTLPIRKDPHAAVARLRFAPGISGDILFVYSHAHFF